MPQVTLSETATNTAEANWSGEAGLRGSGLKGRCKHIDHSTHDRAHVATILPQPHSVSLISCPHRFATQCCQRVWCIKRKHTQNWTQNEAMMSMTRMIQAGEMDTARCSTLNEHRYAISVSGQAHTHTHTDTHTQILTVYVDVFSTSRGKEPLSLNIT